MRNDYADKSVDYFSHARIEIDPLLPPHAQRVLEVGCGRGGTLGWLKAMARCEFSVGIELFADAAADAAQRVDHVFTGNAELMLEQAAELGPFDLVLCLDVLEHMQDPWGFVQRLQALMTPTGLLIVSVPNVRHYRVSLPLLLCGRWAYQQAGVLDRTHLRFFTRGSACELVSPPGFRREACVGSSPPRGSGSWWAGVLSLGLMRDLLSVQYLLSARKC